MTPINDNILGRCASNSAYTESIFIICLDDFKLISRGKYMLIKSAVYVCEHRR